MLRALIVDDEPLARERLGRLLAALDRVEVVGEAEDGEQAIERILTLVPDVVFLDVQMPGCSGLEVAASLPSSGPAVIFCTAFDEHAVEAFELAAVDYLLKPVTRTRLASAVARVRDRGADVPPATGTTGAPHPQRFLARHGSRYRVIPARTVVSFTSDGGLTELHTAEHAAWLQPSLTDLEARLDPSRFCRVSRAAIVNLDQVREVVPDPGGGGKVVLANGTRLDVSRRRMKTLIERLGGT